MEFVIIALILAKFCERGAIDVVSMITGNDPPSKKYREAKGDTAGEGPLGKFVKAWWADAIEDLDEKRRIKRMETKEEQDAARAHRKAERQRIIDAIDEKARADEVEREERERGPAEDIPVEEPPDPEDAEADPIPPVEDTPEEESEEEKERQERWRREKERDAEEDRERHERWRKEAGERRPWEETPPVEETVEGSVDPDQPKGGGPEADTEIFDADIVEATPEIPSGPPGPDIPEFKVIIGEVESGRPGGDTEWSAYGAKPQLYAVPNQEQSTGGAGQTEGTDMTNAEVAVEGGITQHINWTAAVAEYQVRASAHVEIVGASMFKGDNGPARLALVAQIREQHRQLREMYQRLNAVLVNDKNLVGDAYAATGGQAGGKPYVTS